MVLRQSKEQGVSWGLNFRADDGIDRRFHQLCNNGELIEHQQTLARIWLREGLQQLHDDN